MSVGLADLKFHDLAPDDNGPELANAVPQRIFSEENHLIEAAFLHSSYDVRLGVQIRGSRRQFDRFDPYVGQHRQEFLHIQRIAIMNQIPLSSEEAIDLPRYGLN